ncbi:exosortase A [Sphingomonas sp. I4]
MTLSGAMGADRIRPGHWTYHLALLGAAVLMVLWLFWRDATHLFDIWWTSTTYGHCLFIGPVVGWLVWQRRGELAQLTPTAWWPGLILVAGGGLLWLLGESATVALIRQLGLIATLEGLVITLLGPMVARGLLFPLAYAWFLVPFGEELEKPLQQVTVSIVMPLLDWSGIPATNDGVLIHAGRYWFEVAEACSGSKFVLAMVVFATLVANLCFRSPVRRAVFVIVSLIVPVIANGIRAWGTIFAADKTSIEVAGGVDHIIFGWVFFALVMAAVLAIGWQFFDRSPDDPAFDPARLQGCRGGASTRCWRRCWRWRSPRSFPAGAPLPDRAPRRSRSIWRYPRCPAGRQWRSRASGGPTIRGRCRVAARVPRRARASGRSGGGGLLAPA